MKTKIAITLGAMALSAVSGAAYAGSITQPGETVGIAARRSASGRRLFRGYRQLWHAPALSVTTVGLVFTIPVVAWSTPWQILGRTD